MKRIVRLKDKETGELKTYPSVPELIKENKEERLGISMQSLYNAMHTGKGFWENKTYRIYYEDIDIGQTVWK